MAVREGLAFPAEKVSLLRKVIESGGMGGVLEADDCRETYEELKGKGVEFMGPPMERFYGIEAMLKDNSDNWFSMTRRKKE